MNTVFYPFFFHPCQSRYGKGIVSRTISQSFRNIPVRGSAILAANIPPLLGIFVQVGFILFRGRNRDFHKLTIMPLGREVKS